MRLVGRWPSVAANGSGALPALVSLMMSVLRVRVMCVAGGMAWLRYAANTSGCVCAWASLACKCLFGSVGEAMALGAVVFVWEGA